MEYRERVENFSRNYIWRKITGDITIEFLEAAGRGYSLPMRCPV
jgi:hypothetical protein